jgi:hypothetical protein
MSEDRRFRPCEIVELEDTVSLINEPRSLDITPRRQMPLHAVLNDVCSHTAVLAARLESGVVVHSDEQRDAVRALYLQTRRQLEAIAVALDVLAADR